MDVSQGCAQFMGKDRQFRYLPPALCSQLLAVISSGILPHFHSQCRDRLDQRTDNQHQADRQKNRSD